MAGDKLPSHTRWPFAVIALVVLGGAAVLCALVGVMAFPRTERPLPLPETGETATVEKATPLPPSPVPPSPTARAVSPFPSPQARNVELVGQIGGATAVVTVNGSYAYLGVGPYAVCSFVVGAHPRTLFKWLSWYRQGGLDAIRQQWSENGDIWRWPWSPWQAGCPGAG